MGADMLRLELPEPDDAHPLDWYPEDSERVGLPGTLTETGYTLPDGLNLGQWLAIGETLKRMEESVAWWLGDWWRYGERTYGEFASQGAKEAIKEATGKSYKTIQFYAWVCERAEKFGRTNTLSFGHHSVVAALPPDDAGALLVEARDERLSVLDLRDRAKDRKAAIAVEAALTQPAPPSALIPHDVLIEAADARHMPLNDESVHLTVTSPPYGVGIDGYDGGEDILAGDWSAFMLDWLTEALRVTTEHGRLALNVPLDTTRGGNRPTYAQAVQIAVEAGWEYRSSIIWWDDQLGKSVARGSVDSAGAPAIIAGAEMVALFSKGTWRREPPDKASGDEWLQHGEWLDWTNGVWRLTGETQAWEGHPAPFPFELPRRLIKLLSFPDDVVLDPFCGSGTAILAAAQLRRRAIGLDRSARYRDSTLRRVARWRTAS